MFLLVDCTSLLVDCCCCVTAVVFVVLAAAATVAVIVIAIVFSSGIHMQGYEDNCQSWAVVAGIGVVTERVIVTLGNGATQRYTRQPYWQISPWWGSSFKGAKERAGGVLELS